MELNVRIVKLEPQRVALVGQQLSALLDEGGQVGDLIASTPGPILDAMDELVAVCVEIERQSSVGATVLSLINLDRVVDRLVSSICDVIHCRRKTLTLDGFLPLTPEESQLRQQLGAVLGDLIPDGRGFLNLPFGEQYKRVTAFLKTAAQYKDLMDQLDLGSTLERLALLNAHYGAALGLVERPVVELAQPIDDGRELTRNMVRFERLCRRYIIRILNHFDDEADPEHINARLVLLDPIQNQIDAQRRVQ